MTAFTTVFLLVVNLGCSDDKKVSMKMPAGVAFEAPAERNVVAAEAKPTRKVIQKAMLEVTVESIENSDALITQIVSQAKGYVVSSEETTLVGSRRKGNWKIRVPADKFESTLEAIKTLGEITRRNRDMQDVTEEFVDVEVRVKHWKAEEETLLKLMKEKATSTDEILKYRTQITDIREKIERAEGKLKLLHSQTEMSMIELTLVDRDPLAPAEVSHHPSTSIKRTFLASWQAVVDFGHIILVALAGALPWTPLILLIAIVLRISYKRSSRNIPLAPQNKPAD